MLPGSWLAPAFGLFFARSGASLNDKGKMKNDKEAQSALNIYFPRLSGCTSFADSIHSVSDLRFHLQQPSSSHPPLQTWDT